MHFLLRPQETPQEIECQSTNITRHKTLSKRSNAALASALFGFGWVLGGKVSLRKFRKVLHGKGIMVQATAAGRHRNAPSGGKHQL